MTSASTADHTAHADLRDAARRYHDLGWALTRVERGGKAPLSSDWQHAPLPSLADVDRWFGRDGCNIGLRTGSISANVHDLDFDDELLARLAGHMAPTWVADCPTWARGARPHVLIRLEAPQPYRAWRYAGRIILELRGDGHQSVLPPSRHPSGEQYRWLRGPHQPPVVAVDELYAFLDDLIVAFALASDWIRGGRHALTLPVAGWLARRGVPEARTQRLISAVEALHPDAELRDRERAIADTYARVTRGEPATGWPTLQRLLSEEGVRLLRDALGAGARPEECEERAGLYVARGGAVYLRVPPRRDGGDWTEQQLANFDVRIVREELHDDGSDDLDRRLRLEGSSSTGRPMRPALVTAAEFAGMSWVLREFGSSAVIAAGSSTRDKLREAIQRLSGHVPEARIFAHLGWRQIDGRWTFLHAGGSTAVPDVEIDLPPALARYHLPPVAQRPDDRRDAVAASLALLDLGDTPVLSALWCATFLAPLAFILRPDVTLWLWGRSNAWKSTLGALFLCHYGDFERKTLPADWSSSDNMLEKLAFLAKDVPLLIDEFAPAGNRAEQQRLVARASRLIRSQGNLAGRGRMRADTGIRAALQPRGVLISTAESPPPLGESALARTLLLELTPGLINREKLTAAQVVTAKLASAMALFLDWLGRHADELRTALPAMARAARADWRNDGHLRIPEMLALLDLAAGVALTAFADAGAIDDNTLAATKRRIKADLSALGDRQVRQVTQSRPAHRFLDILSELFAKKTVYLSGKKGDEPPDPELFGWEWHDHWTSDGPDRRLEPARTAHRVGWADDDWLYLLPQESYRAAVHFLSDSDQLLAASERALHADLADLNLIETRTDDEGSRRTVPVLIQGRQQRVLKLRRAALDERNSSGAS